MQQVELGRAHSLNLLRPNERKGSKPRCHFLTSGYPEDVAGRLTTLIEPYGEVSPRDNWMPCGFEDTGEAQLQKAERLIRSNDDRKTLGDWWLAEPRPTASTPTWDIASTCSLGGRPGLLLVEAKAHSAELLKEMCGKRVNAQSSDANHNRISSAISDANCGLRAATGLQWNLSSDRCYQMSNRFAWAWKLCTLGYSVALVYLGFLEADEMVGSFQDEQQWQELVKTHGAALVPSEAWGKTFDICGNSFTPLIRARSETISL
jgi:hypothetical protein